MSQQKFIMYLDDEIARLENQIKSLKATKKRLIKDSQLDITSVSSVSCGTPDYSDAIEVINYLSKLRIFHGLTSRSLKTTKERKKMVYARLKDSNIEEAKKLIDTRFKIWLNTPFENYLKVETLFRPSNYFKYVDDIGEIEAKKVKGWDNGNNQDEIIGEF